MQYIVIRLTLMVCLLVFSAQSASAWFFGGDTLVTIDDSSYSTEDFKRWWQLWNTDNEPFPETPDIYIDWLLLAREGARMELDQDPGFKRQTRIYLQSRGLLMLKYEEVDSRIEVTDAEIEERYLRDEVPRWTVQRLVFADDEAAAAAYARVTEGEISAAELAVLDMTAGGPMTSNESQVRPSGIDTGWSEIFRATAVDSLVDPEHHLGGNSLYFVKNQHDGDVDDMAGLYERLQRDLRREQERALTQDLLQRLREKYEVNIDKERLASLDLSAPDRDLSDEPIITTARENVSEKQFIAVVRRLQGSRPAAAHATTDPERAQAFKLETVDNIIAQSLTNWETLERGFEEREPFKWEYQFNYQHRLSVAVEQRMVRPEVVVSEEQIENYYQQNRARFTQPEMVKLLMIDETQAPIDRFWAEVITGKSFRQVLREHFEQQISAQELPLNHLDPEVRQVVEGLAQDETSRIFRAQGVRLLVHMEKRTPARPLALERVRNNIRDELEQQQFDRVRRDYIDQLRAHSRMNVNTRQWRNLQKEFGGA